MRDLDVYILIAEGRRILSLRYVPVDEVFASVPTHLYTTTVQWLWKLLLALSDAALGFPGVLLLKGIVGVLLSLSIYRLARLFAEPNASALVLLLTTLFLWNYANSRAQITTFLFLILCLTFFKREEKLESLPWSWCLGWPLAFLGWSQFHQGHELGLLLLLLFLGTHFRERIFTPPLFFRALLLLFLCLLAPSFTNMVGGYSIFGMPYRRDIEVAPPTEWLIEWERINPLNPYYALFILYVISQAVALWRVRDLHLSFRLFTLMGIAVPFFAQRFLPIACLLFVPMTAHTLSWRLLSPSRATAASLLLLLLFFRAPYHWVFPFEVWNLTAFRHKYLPLDGLEVLRRNEIPQPLFHPLGWGGLILYELYPRYKVASDARFSLVYPPDYLREAGEAENGVGWDRFAHKYGFRSAWVAKKMPLYHRLRFHPHWSKIYEDDKSALFILSDAISEVAKGPLETPESFTYAFFRATQALRQGKREEALSYLRKGRRLKPCDGELIEHEAAILFDLEKPGEARSLLQRHRFLFPLRPSYLELSQRLGFRPPPLFYRLILAPQALLTHLTACHT